MTSVAGCDFCDVVSRDEPARVVLRTPEAVAFFPTEPATLGHTLVIPRSHIRDIWALPTAIAHDLTEAVLQVAKAVRLAMAPDGLNIIQSNGAAATQTVPHLHVHVVPRWNDDGFGDIWPSETSFAEDSKNDACERVRQALREPE